MSAAPSSVWGIASDDHARPRTELLPPYARALDMTITGLHNGAPLIEMPFANKVQGRPGFLHGGAISGLLEMAAVAAIQHALHERGDEATFKQVNVTIDFMRGGTPQPTYAVGEVTRSGPHHGQCRGPRLAG
jgi:uncharacterized protein (TIGR00369 family)